MIGCITGVYCIADLPGAMNLSPIILPHCLRNQVLSALHDNNGHQSLQRVIDLLRERSIGLLCSRTLNAGFPSGERCLVSKGDYYEPKTVQGSLVSNQPLELLCNDFTKADVAKGGKEIFLFSPMPFPNTVRLSLHPIRSLSPWLRYL